MSPKTGTKEIPTTVDTEEIIIQSSTSAAKRQTPMTRGERWTFIVVSILIAFLTGILIGMWLLRLKLGM